jgi:predicted component of type VI protein secretion system
MNKKDIEKLLFIALALAAIVVVLLVSASILAPPKRSSKAEKVDLSCVAEQKANPLKECKE